MYHAQVSYLFSVQGQEYLGEIISLGDYSTSDPGNAEKVIARYPLGKTVRVYYEPGKPEKSVLEPGLTGGLWIPLGIGVIITPLAGIMTYALLRKILRGQQSKAIEA